MFRTPSDGPLEAGKIINTTVPLVEEDFVKGLAIDWERFKPIFDTLCKRWLDEATSIIQDTVGKRVVTNALRSCETNPVIVSIIADDPESFARLRKVDDDVQYLFELCCVCGSKEIIKKLLAADEEKMEFLANSENAVGYALSSGDLDLAWSLAELKLSKLNEKELGPYRLYSSPSVYLSFTKKLRVYDAATITPNKLIFTTTDIYKSKDKEYGKVEDGVTGKHGVEIEKLLKNPDLLDFAKKAEPEDLEQLMQLLNKVNQEERKKGSSRLSVEVR